MKKLPGNTAIIMLVEPRCGQVVRFNRVIGQRGLLKQVGCPILWTNRTIRSAEACWLSDSIALSDNAGRQSMLVVRFDCVIGQPDQIVRSVMRLPLFTRPAAGRIGIGRDGDTGLFWPSALHGFRLRRCCRLPRRRSGSCF